MPFTKQGKIELLTSFKNNTYELGLFASSLSGTNIFNNSAILEDVASYEVDKIEYARKTILPAEWTLDENNLELTLNKSKLYNMRIEDWENIKGYFLIDEEEKLVLINIIDIPIFMPKYSYVDININLKMS